MCSATAAKMILDVLEKKVNNGDVFTSYDVTTEVRALTSENIRHGEVKKIIRQEFQNGDMVNYNVELRTLTINDSPDAFVFFPDGKKATDHPLVKKTDADDSDEAEEVDEVDEVDDIDGYDGAVVNITAAGRLNIPKELLKQVNAVGGSYDIMFKGTVYPKKPASDGRIRLSKNDLGISSNKVKITVDTSNTILIESI
jgi:hypothetical protein